MPATLTSHDSSIGATRQASNKAVMDQQQDITDFESQGQRERGRLRNDFL